MYVFNIYLVMKNKVNGDGCIFILYCLCVNDGRVWISLYPHVADEIKDTLAAV